MNTKRIALLVVAALVIAAISVGAGFGLGSALFKSSSTNATHEPWFASFQADANKIFAHLTSANGAGKGLAFSWLANIADTFGNRRVENSDALRMNKLPLRTFLQSGSKGIKDATDYVVSTLKSQGFSNVHTEEAPIENWIRGEEVAKLLAPREYPMAILGLGSSVPTPPEGINASAFVVDSFKDLDDAGKAGKIKDKIVIYNEPWLGSYDQTVAYRVGADHASYYGAVAVLIRSVTPFSIYTPHTGIAHYSPTFNNVSVKPIPQASITVEDSMMLRRMQDRGQSLTVFLKMTSYENGTTPGNNIVFEWTGSEFPNEYIVLTGHFDSWDVGQGAMDDGGGCAVAWNTLTALKKLGFQPRRTIRGIFWAGEEMGYKGVLNYWKNHKNSTEKWIFAFESDEGAFMPSGPANNTYFEAKGNATAIQRLQDIADNILAANGILFSIRTTDDAGGEVNFWADLGTVAANYINDEKVHGYYFYFHHTNADTMTVLKPEDLDYVTAVLATYTHIIANMDKPLSVP